MRFLFHSFLVFLFVMPCLSGFAQKTKKRIPITLCDMIMDDSFWFICGDFFINDNMLPTYLQEIYKKDATRLAIQLLTACEPQDQQPINVYEELTQKIYNNLIIIRLSNFPAVDSISRMFNIRSNPSIFLNYLVLATRCAPMPAHEDKPGIAKDSIFDDITRKLSLIKIRETYLNDSTCSLSIYSKTPINIDALTKKIEKETHYTPLEQILPWGDGNDIEVAYTPAFYNKKDDKNTESGLTFTYKLRFDDCSEKCKKEHYWRFFVADSYEVLYLGSGGDPIPDSFKQSYLSKKFPDVLKE